MSNCDIFKSFGKCDDQPTSPIYIEEHFCNLPQGEIDELQRIIEFKTNRGALYRLKARKTHFTKHTRYEITKIEKTYGSNIRVPPLYDLAFLGKNLLFILLNNYLSNGFSKYSLNLDFFESLIERFYQKYEKLLIRQNVTKDSKFFAMEMCSFISKNKAVIEDNHFWSIEELRALKMQIEQKMVGIFHFLFTLDIICDIISCLEKTFSLHTRVWKSKKQTLNMLLTDFLHLRKVSKNGKRKYAFDTIYASFCIYEKIAFLAHNHHVPQNWVCTYHKIACDAGSKSHPHPMNLVKYVLFACERNTKLCGFKPIPLKDLANYEKEESNYPFLSSCVDDLRKEYIKERKIYSPPKIIDLSLLINEDNEQMFFAVSQLRDIEKKTKIYLQVESRFIEKIFNMIIEHSSYQFHIGRLEKRNERCDFTVERIDVFVRNAIQLNNFLNHAVGLLKVFRKKNARWSYSRNNTNRNEIILMIDVIIDCFTNVMIMIKEKDLLAKSERTLDKENIQAHIHNLAEKGLDLPALEKFVSLSFGGVQCVFNMICRTNGLVEIFNNCKSLFKTIIQMLNAFAYCDALQHEQKRRNLQVFFQLSLIHDSVKRNEDFLISDVGRNRKKIASDNRGYFARFQKQNIKTIGNFMKKWKNISHKIFTTCGSLSTSWGKSGIEISVYKNVIQNDGVDIQKFIETFDSKTPCELQYLAVLKGIIDYSKKRKKGIVLSGTIYNFIFFYENENHMMCYDLFIPFILKRMFNITTIFNEEQIFTFHFKSIREKDDQGNDIFVNRAFLKTDYIIPEKCSLTCENVGIAFFKKNGSYCGINALNLQNPSVSISSISKNPMKKVNFTPNSDEHTQFQISNTCHTTPFRGDITLGVSPPCRYVSFTIDVFRGDIGFLQMMLDGNTHILKNPSASSILLEDHSKNDLIDRFVEFDISNSQHGIVKKSILDGVVHIRLPLEYYGLNAQTENVASSSSDANIAHARKYCKKVTFEVFLKCDQIIRSTEKTYSQKCDVGFNFTVNFDDLCQKNMDSHHKSYSTLKLNSISLVFNDDFKK